MKNWKNIEYVGWVFWVICSLVLLIPNYFLSRYLIYDYSRGARIGLTVAMSAILGAVVAWVVNEILYRINLSKYKERRKQIRKKRKKSS